jgi:hypothetical protein
VEVTTTAVPACSSCLCTGVCHPVGKSEVVSRRVSFGTNPASPEIKAPSVPNVSPTNGGQMVVAAALDLLSAPSRNSVPKTGRRFHLPSRAFPILRTHLADLPPRLILVLLTDLPLRSGFTAALLQCPVE